MASNRLAGSGPTVPTPGAGDGPSPGLAGTLGATPQAAPQTAPNMLSSGGQPPPQGMPPGGAPGGQGAPLVPPSREVLMQAMTKQGYVVRSLKALLGKPDLADRDVLNAVGEIVADQIMSPFQATDYLKDLPTDAEPLQLRQWVGKHYATASQHLQTVAEMINAHGAMTRGGGTPGAPMAPQQPSPQMPPANVLSAPQQPQASPQPQMMQ